MNKNLVSPTSTTTLKEEKEILQNLIKKSPNSIFVVSDLHLSTGCDPDTGTFSSTENFFADDAFSRWLKYYKKEAGESAILILNGDIFDFIRIMEIPETNSDFEEWSAWLKRLNFDKSPEQLNESINPTEKKFGLRTNDYKTVWKLLLIIKGHQPFFEALANWLSNGGKIIFVKGNHDLEFNWPLVRSAIRDEFVKLNVPVDKANQDVAFVENEFTIKNIYVEHGHKYEDMTCVFGEPILKKNKDELNLPFGSFMNRYCVNKIERFAPFLDNIKPVTQAFLAILRRKPLTILSIYFNAWKFISKGIFMKRVFNGAFFFILSGLVVPIVTVVLLALYFSLPPVEQFFNNLIPFWIRAGGLTGGILFPFLLPYIIGMLVEITGFFKSSKSHDYPVSTIKEILSKFFPSTDKNSIVYFIMGHTHEQDVRKLDTKTRDEYYINSGAWIPLWPKERLDLIGRVFNSFSRFDLNEDDEYRHQALVWDDQAKEPRPALILVQPNS